MAGVRARAEKLSEVSPRKANDLDNLLEWTVRIPKRFGSYCKYPFGQRHTEFWEWADSITDERPDPFVALWPRGGAKSTTAEMFTADCGERNVRPYCVYISETQEQADKHVAAVATLFERRNINRAVNKYGNSKGWRRNRIATDTGFTVDALGFDTAARGIKLDENRPGIMIFDDVDGGLDTVKTTQKKIDIMTKTLLPAQAENCIILFVQNLIHRDSIASRLSDGRADFLIDRIVSGPFPAIEDLKVEVQFDEKLNKNRTIIIGGEATWEGQSIESCQKAIDTFGFQPFLMESQHDVFRMIGAIFNRDWFEKVERVPEDGMRVRKWDLAATEGGGDWTVGLLMAKVGGTYYIEDVRRFQYSSGKRDAEILKIAIADREKYGFNCKIVGPVDPGSAGVDAALSFRQKLDGFPVATERETGPKAVRAQPGAAAAEIGNVKMLKANWNEEFLMEVERFTGEPGGIDDQADSFSGAYNELAQYVQWAVV